MGMTYKLKYRYSWTYIPAWTNFMTYFNYNTVNIIPDRIKYIELLKEELEAYNIINTSTIICDEINFNPTEYIIFNDITDATEFLLRWG